MFKVNKDKINSQKSDAFDNGDQTNPNSLGDGGNIASFLQNLTSKDYQDALIAQNVSDNTSRALGPNEQAYCDGNFNGQHLVVRFTPGFDPREHKNEANAQRTVYLEPAKGQQQGYYNCLTNCHYDKNGHLVGTPAHAYVDNPQTGHITVYIPPNTPEVTMKNHFPSDQKQNRSVNT